MIRTHQLKGNELVDRLKQLSNPINESVSMVEVPKYHNRISPTSRLLQTWGKNKSIEDMDDDEEIDIDEILKELEREEDSVDLGDFTEEDIRNYIKDEVRNRFYEEVEDERLFDEMIDEILMDEVSQFKELTEGTIKFDGIELRGGFSGGNSNTLVYRPISSKMMDKIEDMGVSEDKIIKKIISFLQKKHRGLKFQQDYSYEGYGYPIKLDMWSFN